MAIARDAGTQGQTTTDTLTIAKAVAVDNPIVFAHVILQNQTDDTVNSATWAGSAMTLIGTLQKKASVQYTYYKEAPTTGTQNFVATHNDNGNWIAAYVFSYTGVAQSSAINVSGQATSTSNPTTASVVTTVDNCWAILGVVVNSTSNLQPTASTGSSLLQRAFAEGDAIFDSNGALATAGTFNMAYGDTTSSSAWTMAAFKPYVAPSNTNFLAFM
jgi:hypothetical protein